MSLEFCNVNGFCNVRKNAFTLAEVLITLGIIGIVAAMTIPNLVNDYNNNHFSELFKDTYSKLSQVSMTIASENGDSMETFYASGTNAQKVFDEFSKHLKFSKVCGLFDANGGCFHSTVRSQLNGNPSSYPHSGYSQSPGWATGILTNGVSIAFRDNNRNSCKNNRGDGVLTFCDSIEIDVNGPKLPNKLGRDVFSMNVLKNGRIDPSGAHISAEDLEASCNVVTGPGHGCSYRVITEGKQNY